MSTHNGVMSCMVDGSETWILRSEHTLVLERAAVRMTRRTCEASMNYKNTLMMNCVLASSL